MEREMGVGCMRVLINVVYTFSIEEGGPPLYTVYLVAVF
jgi:hypothetical protein